MRGDIAQPATPKIKTSSLHTHSKVASSEHIEMDNYQCYPKLENIPQYHLDRTGSGVQSRKGGRMAEVFGYEVDLPPRSSAVTNVFGNKVDLLDELGRGGFGTVYKGCNKWGKMIAIKKVSKKDKAKASGIP